MSVVSIPFVCLIRPRLSQLTPLFPPVNPFFFGTRFSSPPPVFAQSTYITSRHSSHTARFSSCTCLMVCPPNSGWLHFFPFLTQLMPVFFRRRPPLHDPRFGWMTPFAPPPPFSFQEFSPHTGALPPLFPATLPPLWVSCSANAGFVFPLPSLFWQFSLVFFA